MLFLCGDTHGSFEIDKIFNKEFLESYPFTRDDILIVLGDFGLFRSNKPDKDELYFLDIIEVLPFTLCFIDGNHENFNRLFEFKTMQKFGGTLSKCAQNCYWLRRGEIYKICGKNIFTFGGAMSRDKIYRKSNLSWWKEETPSQEEFEYGLKNLRNFYENGEKIDMVLSHTAPNFLVSLMGFGGEIDKTCLYLENYFYEIKPKEWYFGHFHEDKEFIVKNCKFKVLYNEIIGLR